MCSNTPEVLLTNQWKLSVELEDWDGGYSTCRVHTVMNDKLHVQGSNSMDMGS